VRSRHCWRTRGRWRCRSNTRRSSGSATRWRAMSAELLGVRLDVLRAELKNCEFDRRCCVEGGSSARGCRADAAELRGVWEAASAGFPVRDEAVIELPALRGVVRAEPVVSGLLGNRVAEGDEGLVVAFALPIGGGGSGHGSDSFASLARCNTAQKSVGSRSADRRRVSATRGIVNLYVKRSSQGSNLKPSVP
jgi:hypothetical protein